MPPRRSGFNVSTENEKLDRLVAQVDRIERYLTGDDKPSEGIIVRLDRLEQKSESTTSRMNAVGVAAIGALITAGGSIAWKIILLVSKP